MYDTFKPLMKVKKFDFVFRPTRYEIWQEGKLISKGKTKSNIIAKVIDTEQGEKVKVIFDDDKLNSELAKENIFDEFISLKDRLQLITIPFYTNAEIVALTMYKMVIGPTREEKHFSYSDPYCCNLFYKNGVLAKVTFSFSNPERLIEFYSDNLQNEELRHQNSEKKKTKNLNFTFISSDHIRYENGLHVSGPHGGARRAIKVEPNISGGEGYTVTIFNLDGIHPLWRNNIQMAPKPMRIVRETENEIELRGFGYDPMGFPYDDYGLTIIYQDGEVKKCIAHMYDRNVDIEYLP